jgi:hypothetical protein
LISHWLHIELTLSSLRVHIESISVSARNHIKLGLVSIWYQFEFIWMSLRGHVEFSSIWLPVRSDITSTSLRCHFKVISTSVASAFMALRVHFDRVHFDVTSSSLRCHFDFTSCPLRIHLHVTLILYLVSLRFHFDFTLPPGKRERLLGEEEKDKGPRPRNLPWISLGNQTADMRTQTGRQPATCQSRWIPQQWPAHSAHSAHASA